MRDPSRPAFCLLVEDDPLVGLDLAEALDAAGFYVAGPFRSGREAARWLERFTPDVAVVDLTLPDGPCRGLIRALRARGIPFLVHSGSRRGDGPIPARPDEPWFEKPACAAAIAGALHRLLVAPRGIEGAPPLLRCSNDDTLVTKPDRRLRMTMPFEPEPGRPASVRSSPFVDDVPNFEAIFGIPAAHRLLAVRSRSRGGGVASITWEHEEYDTSGACVARYESFEETTAAGSRRSGWRKFGPTGGLLATGDDLA